MCFAQMVLYTLLPRILHNTFMTLKASFRYVHFMYMFFLEKLVHFDIPWSRYRWLQGALLRTQIPLLSCIQFFKYFGQNYESLGVFPSYGKSRIRLCYSIYYHSSTGFVRSKFLVSTMSLQP